MTPHVLTAGFIVVITLSIISTAFIIWARMTETKDYKRRALIFEYERRLGEIAVFLHQVSQCKTLDDLFLLHKNMAERGYANNSYLGEQDFGMFRTAHIVSMTKDEVHLGDIYGLFDRTLSFWERCEDAKSRDIVFGQYKQQILNGIAYEQVTLENAIKNI